MIICADARRIPLANESVQCVVTSPPYWGLRKYAGEQELTWGQDVVCAFGLEPTIAMYVQHTVIILREIGRVLRKDGVCFWNIGDSYHGANKGNSGTIRPGDKQATNKGSWDTRRRDGGCLSPSRSGSETSIKCKDLCLIPQRVALAAQADGWWMRSDIIWHKPNPMPESVKDRPTDAYEHILMLTKSERYFWDNDAVQEPHGHNRWGGSHYSGSDKWSSQNSPHRHMGKTSVLRKGGNHFPGEGRNIRNVWQFATQPFSGAHFATFPEELPRRCIKAASRLGDLILDPFGGSGTTARVAIELQRNPILLDLAYARDYTPLAKKRTTNVQLEAFV